MSNGNECMTPQEQDIKELQDKVNKHLTDEHEDQHEFIKILIEKEKDKKALRRAIIEKTLTSLIWAFIVFIVTSLWTALKSQR